MASCATHTTAEVEPVKPATAAGWSAGWFAVTGCQPPPACLCRCLMGNPNLADTRGCAMVRRLAGRSKPATKLDHPLAGARGSDQPVGGEVGGVRIHSIEGHAESFQAPLVCDQGYGVSPSSPGDPSEPHVLVLYPLPATEAVQDALGPVIETLRSAMLDHWRLSRENEGLANEVLDCYEQVNLIFDITGEVAVLTEADQIRRVLLQKLRYIYAADSVFYLNPHSQITIEVDASNTVIQQRGAPPFFSHALATEPPDEGRGRGDGAQRIVLPPEAESALRQLQSSRRVFACSEGDQELARRGMGTSIWGPLRKDDTRFAMVGVVRRRTPFEAGDMLLLDSTLTFAGHILNNMRLVERVQRASFEAVRALVNAIDQKDPYTCGHSERVGFLAKATGTFMGLSSRQLQELEWGGLLHDIGKIGIPESLLNKPGSLTADEFAVIKHHPARGFSVLKPVESLEGVLEVVLHHHESPDGSGYPDGLTKEAIPLLARIVHVVDTFDALTSTRPYREAFDTKRAIGILQGDAGTKLDPDIVEAFLGTWAALPDHYPDEYARWFGSQREKT